MDDSYAIRLAKTRLRDAYRRGSVNGVLSVFAERYVDMSAGLASFYGDEARAVLKYRMKKLFARYDVRLAVTIVSIRVQGSLAFDRGYHQLTLTSRKSGRRITIRTRYLEIWQRSAAEKWKIAVYMDNEEVPPQMPPKGVLAELAARRVVEARPSARKRGSKRGQSV